MLTPGPRSRTADLVYVALGIALACVSYALFRGVGRDHVLYGVPALVMLVLLSLKMLKPPQGRSFGYFLAGVTAAAVVLRIAVGTPL